MKSYTDLEQSRKLAEILPHESADMCWFEGEPFVEAVTGYEEERAESHRQAGMEMYPCWSLAALLEQFNDTAGLAKDYGLWFCYDNRKSYCTKHYDNPVDTCVEMILKLHETKML